MRAEIVALEPRLVPAAGRAAARSRLDLLIEQERRPRRLEFVRRHCFAVAAVAIAAALAGLDWTAVASFDSQLFGSDAPVTPAAIRQAFAELGPPDMTVDLDTVSSLGTFTTPAGTTVVYGARTKHGNGWQLLYVREGRLITGYGSLPPPQPVSKIAVQTTGGGSTFPGVWEVVGVVPDGTVMATLGFQDGRTIDLPLHSGLFAYFAGDNTDACEPGRQPQTLTAYGPDGAILDHAESVGFPARC